MASGTISLNVQLALNGIRLTKTHISGDTFSLFCRLSNGSFTDLPEGQQVVVEYDNISHTTDQNLSLYMLGIFIPRPGDSQNISMATLSVAEVGNDRFLGATYMMDVLEDGRVSLNFSTYSNNIVTISPITLCDTLTTDIPEVQVTIDHENTSTPTIET